MSSAQDLRDDPALLEQAHEIMLRIMYLDVGLDASFRRIPERIVVQAYEAGAVLFEMEPESHRVYFAEFDPDREDLDPDEETGRQTEVAP